MGIAVAGVYSPPSEVGDFQARVRLGSGAGGGVVRPGRGAGGRPDTAGGWLAGRRLVAIDGMCVMWLTRRPMMSSSGVQGEQG